ncbi:hypothetical protein WL32_33840 [Burkholderia cepacia]|nr:hypothetical protein WL32_33840 [Burkholderia cepacia]
MVACAGAICGENVMSLVYQSLRKPGFRVGEDNNQRRPELDKLPRCVTVFSDNTAAPMPQPIVLRQRTDCSIQESHCLFWIVCLQRKKLRLFS